MNYASIYGGSSVEHTQGRNFTGGGPRPLGPVPGAPARSPINTWIETAGHGAVIALVFKPAIQTAAADSPRPLESRA